VYLALGINLEGHKELLGLWVGETEGSKFWLNVLTELKNRGVADILIACVDGLKGFPDAIETIYPKTQIQLCIVHSVPGRAHSKEVKRPLTGKTFKPVSLGQVAAA
jgi:putative transposase